MTTLFIVRHALTEHTGRRLSGRSPGVSLTDEGLAQAQKVSEGLNDVPLRAVYSSPIDRALETARAIAATKGLRVQPRDGLSEVDYGRWTDRPLKGLMRTRLWGTIQRFPSAARFPEGESLHDVQARAVGEVEGIRRDHPKDSVCLVSHGDVIKLLLSHYLGVHIDLFQRIFVAPASVSVVNVSEYGPLVLSVNATPMTLPAR